MIAMFGGKVRLRVKDKLYKLEGFPVTKNTRREMTGLSNVQMCNKGGSVHGIPDESSDKVNQAVVAPGRASPQEIDWNVLHASLAASTKPMDVKSTRHLHPREGCVAANEIRKALEKATESTSDRRLGGGFVDLPRQKKTETGGGNWYATVVLHDCNRYMWVFFLAKKSNASRVLG